MHFEKIKLSKNANIELKSVLNSEYAYELSNTSYTIF